MATELKRQLDEAATAVRSRAGAGPAPAVGIILGTGLGDFADVLEGAVPPLDPGPPEQQAERDVAQRAPVVVRVENAELVTARDERRYLGAQPRGRVRCQRRSGKRQRGGHGRGSTPWDGFCERGYARGWGLSPQL